MTKLNQVYKCEVCGNIVELIHAGAGELVCCGQPMKLKEENIEEAALEKHIPVILKTEKGVIVKVGEMPHPMTAEHYIEWIELIDGDKICRKYLKAGDEALAEFSLNSENLKARAYCNLHGLWVSK